MGAKPWHARTQVAYAELLLARRGAGDVERATEMLADAIVVADALGMVVLAEKARRLVPSHAQAWRQVRSHVPVASRAGMQPQPTQRRPTAGSSRRRVPHLTHSSAAAVEASKRAGSTSGSRGSSRVSS